MSFNESDGVPGSPLKQKSTSPHDIEIKHQSSMNRIPEMEDIEDMNEEDEEHLFSKTMSAAQLKEAQSKDELHEFKLEADKAETTLPSSRKPLSAIKEKEKSAKTFGSQKSLGDLERSGSEHSSLVKKKEKRVKILTKSNTVEIKQLKKEKVSKVVAGHLMAVRDKRRATIMEHHLFDHCKSPHLTSNFLF